MLVTTGAEKTKASAQRSLLVAISHNFLFVFFFQWMTSKGQSNPLVSRNCNVRHVELLLCRITYLPFIYSSATTVINHYKDNNNSLINDAGVKIKFCNNFKKKIL